MQFFSSLDKFEGRCTAAEVGQPWELRWGISDAEAGRCSMEDVGMARVLTASEPVDDRPHPLLDGLDPDHPDTDRAILRRLYHADPEKFLDSYGTAGINKLMDIAVKEDRPERLPPVTDAAEWQKLMKTIVRMAEKEENPKMLATPVLHLCVLHQCGGDPVRMAQMILDVHGEEG